MPTHKTIYAHAFETSRPFSPASIPDNTVYFGNLSCRDNEETFEKSLLIHGNLHLNCVHGLLPEHLVVYGTSYFQNQRDNFPARMSLSGSVHVSDCQLVTHFGQHTQIAADLHFEGPGIVELHSSLVVSGKISSSETLLIIPEAAYKNISEIDITTPFILVDESTRKTNHSTDLRSRIQNPSNIEVDAYLAELEEHLQQRQSAGRRLRRFLRPIRPEHALSNDQKTRSMHNIVLTEYERIQTSSGFSQNLHISGTDWTTLPDGISVRGSFIIKDCPNIRQLPEHLSAASLHIINCPELRQIPSSTRCRSLNIENCKSLHTFALFDREIHSISVSGCPSISKFLAFNYLKTVNFTTDSPQYISYDAERTHISPEALPMMIHECVTSLIEQRWEDARNNLDEILHIPPYSAQLYNVLTDLRSEMSSDQNIMHLLGELETFSILEPPDELFDDNGEEPESLQTLMEKLHTEDDVEAAVIQAKELCEITHLQILELLMQSTTSPLQKQFLTEVLQDQFRISAKKTTLKI